MSEGLMYQQITEALAAKVRERVKTEVVPMLYSAVDKIVAEEVAGIAVSIGRFVDFRQFDNKLVIEVRMPERKP